MELRLNISETRPYQFTAGNGDEVQRADVGWRSDSAVAMPEDFTKTTLGEIPHNSVAEPSGRDDAQTIATVLIRRTKEDEIPQRHPPPVFLDSRELRPRPQANAGFERQSHLMGSDDPKGRTEAELLWPGTPIGSRRSGASVPWPADVSARGGRSLNASGPGNHGLGRGGGDWVDTYVSLDSPNEA